MYTSARTIIAIANFGILIGFGLGVKLMEKGCEKRIEKARREGRDAAANAMSRNMCMMMEKYLDKRDGLE